MNCARCNTPLLYSKRQRRHYCPVEFYSDTQAQKNPFLTNQMVCLPFLDFVAQYPDVMGRKRFKIFEEIGYDCVQCGMIGSHVVWWQEYKKGTNHYDIAGYKDGKLLMITIDHIYPKSKGGPDDIANYQPMCSTCNGRKSDKIVS